MRGITRSDSHRGALLRLVMLVALLVATAPGGLVAAPQIAATATPDVVGNVTDADTGLPIAGAVVSGYHMAWPPWQGGGPWFFGPTITDANGDYTLEVPFEPVIRPGSEDFWINVYADGYAQSSVRFEWDAEAEKVVDFELAEGDLALYGVVTDAWTGDPIENINVGVSWTIGEGEAAEYYGADRFTGPDGSYAFYGLPVDVEFEISFSPWPQVEGYQWSEETFLRTFDGVTAIEFDYEMQPLLPYFQVDSAGDRVMGWRWTPDVEIEIEITRGLESETFTVWTNPEGFFYFDSETWEIQPGDEVVVTDTDTLFEKDHVVTQLSVEMVDVEGNTISGIDDQESEIVIEVWGEEHAANNRVVDVDLNGDWVVDYGDWGMNQWGEWSPPYELQYRDEGSVANTDVDGDATVAFWSAGEPPVIAVAGGSRWETAVLASQEAYPDGLDPAGAKAVVIATGRNWPDALGGSALAGALDGPILLTNTNALPAVVLPEIERLGAEKAYIVGGDIAVGDDVFDALETELGVGMVERVAGTNRYTTADAVALKTIEILGAGYDGIAFVATGAAYADAVAAAPLAAAQGWPLFLASPGGVRDATLVAMADVTDVLALGGTSAVSATTYAQLEAEFGAARVDRLWGTTRYGTAAAIATFAVEEAGHSWDRVGIATGQSYPDALAGGVLQGKMGSVMLLTRTASLPPEPAAALDANKVGIDTVTYFGGTLAVSDAVRNAVAQILE